MAFPALLKSQFIQKLRKNGLLLSDGWTNYMATVSNPAALVIEVKNEAQLQLVLKEIYALNEARSQGDKITLRVTGGFSDSRTSDCSFFSCFAPWSKTQINSYNEGYSFSQVVGGRAAAETPGTDVIIRFSKGFHHIKVLGPVTNPTVVNPDNPIHKLPCTLVEVSAGVQVAELATFLRTKNLSLSTVSMISWVTAVGLAGTGGHGTGRDEPSFSGLIESMKICDMQGVIREIDSTHPDFATLCGAHSGLLGVVLSVKLRAVKAFNLRETIDLFSNSKEMKGQLDAILKGSQYVSIMGIPSYTSSDTFAIPRWQIRNWNYSEEKPTAVVAAPYDPDVRSLHQELEVKLGASAMDFLLDSGLQHLLPSFMAMSAAMVIGTRGVKPVVDYENHITHPQVAFPKAMRDVSYIIPVKDEEAGAVLEKIVKRMEDMLNDGAKKGEFPITYAIYVRYFKGTNGGLSTSTTLDDEHILAIDVVTHPEAPGIASFEQKFMQFLKEIKHSPRNHLGKNFPFGVTRYDQFLGSDAIDTYLQALCRWYETKPGLGDGVHRLAKSPFVTPYLDNMLSVTPSLTAKAIARKNLEALEKQRPHLDHTDVECRDFLTKLHAEISKREVPIESKAAKTLFLDACAKELEVRNARIEQQVTA